MENVISRWREQPPIEDGNRQILKADLPLYILEEVLLFLDNPKNLILSMRASNYLEEEEIEISEFAETVKAYFLSRLFKYFKSEWCKFFNKYGASDVYKLNYNPPKGLMASYYDESDCMYFKFFIKVTGSELCVVSYHP